MNDYYATVGLFIVCKQPKVKTFDIQAGVHQTCTNCTGYDPRIGGDFCNRCGARTVERECYEQVDFRLDNLFYHEDELVNPHPLMKFLSKVKVVCDDEYEGSDSYIELTGTSIDVMGDGPMVVPFVSKDDITKAEKKHAKLITALKEYYKSVKVEYLLVPEIN